MQNHQQGRDRASEEASQDARLRWVAPLDSLATFSIAEFTNVDALPGDDGLGVFTQS